MEQNLRFRTSLVGVSPLQPHIIRLSWKLTKIRCRPVELEAHKDPLQGVVGAGPYKIET